MPNVAQSGSPGGQVDLPTGTVSFLFTDIEGSTRLWEDEPEEMQPALELHDELTRAAIAANKGHVVKTTGDGFHAAFASPTDAVAAATAIQRSLLEARWPTSIVIRVRAGVHTGEGQLRDGDYYGPTLNRAARLTAAAHGGQIVCSAPTSELVRDRLADGVWLVDLGEHRLRDLARPERVFQVAHPGLPCDFPELRTIDTLPGNLPMQPNRFVGRDELVADIARILTDSRVVTITGPGGVGKTRLALQVAAAVQPGYDGGAWFVDLAPVTDPGQVAAELLETLDYLLAEDEDEIAGLCARLRRRDLLLILDNCEHLTAGVAEVADAITKTADDVRILATSREGLGIPAEQVEPIPPLDTDPEGDAVRLFVTRARAARPNFELDDTNRDSVVELCRRLDGIPLAIELAAARTRSVSPLQILERVDERFRILTGGSRTSAARHQTLQAAVDWSYDLLAQDERTVLSRLSVFAGGFTLDAAESVASDETIDPFFVLDHLDRLVDKSLVVADDTHLGRRYRLLETIRQYAAERLDRHDDAAAIRARHAAHYLGVTRTVAPELVGRDEILALDTLDADLDNIRAMLEWHLDHERADVVAVTLADLEAFVVIRDGGLWAIPLLDECLASPLDDTVRAVAHAARAWFKVRYGNAEVRDDVEAARVAAGRAGLDTPILALAAESTDATLGGDPVRGYELADRLVHVARTRGDDYWSYHGQITGLTFRCLAQPDAPELVDRAALVRRNLDRAWDIPYLRDTYLLAAALAHVMTDPPAALGLLEEKLEVSSELHARFGVADAHFFIGLMQLSEGDVPAAARSCHRALIGHHDVGNRRGMLMDLSGAAGIAAQSGRTDTAVSILAGLRRAREEYGAPGSSNEQFAEERIARRIARELGENTLADTHASDLEATIDITLDVLATIARTPT